MVILNFSKSIIMTAIHFKIRLKYPNYKSVIFLISLFIAFTSDSIGQSLLEKHKEHFKNPPMDCWPHTRWWWSGNATTKKNITYELKQMRSHGIRGVEQITMAPYYEKGNIKYST